eukprot:4699091-Prymnesium_polylepis.1
MMLPTPAPTAPFIWGAALSSLAPVLSEGTLPQQRQGSDDGHSEATEGTSSETPYTDWMGLQHSDWMGLYPLFLTGLMLLLVAVWLVRRDEKARRRLPAGLDVESGQMDAGQSESHEVVTGDVTPIPPTASRTHAKKEGHEKKVIKRSKKKAKHR